MAAGEVIVIPCLSDNYTYLVRCHYSDVTAVIDPGEAAPVIAALEERGWNLDLVINTHHHHDHTGGNLELKQETNCKIIGPRAEADRIPGIDIGLSEGETCSIGSAVARVIETPGHTLGQINYWFEIKTI